MTERATYVVPTAMLIALAVTLGGCDFTVSAGAGGWAHGAGPTATEEAARATVGLAGGEGGRRFALEVGGEGALGQRLDADGTSWRGSALVDVRLHPEAWTSGSVGTFLLAGASLEFMGVEGYSSQTGGLLHAGLGGTLQLNRDARLQGSWLGLLLEAVVGAFASSTPSSGPGASVPALPSAFFAGLRLSVFFEGFVVVNTR